MATSKSRTGHAYASVIGKPLRALRASTSQERREQHEQQEHGVLHVGAACTRCAADPTGEPAERHEEQDLTARRSPPPEEQARSTTAGRAGAYDATKISSSGTTRRSPADRAGRRGQRFHRRAVHDAWAAAARGLQHPSNAAGRSKR